MGASFWFELCFIKMILATMKKEVVGGREIRSWSGPQRFGLSKQHYSWPFNMGLNCAWIFFNKYVRRNFKDLRQFGKTFSFLSLVVRIQFLVHITKTHIVMATLSKAIKFGGVKGIHRLSSARAIGTPNPHVVKGQLHI